MFRPRLPVRPGFVLLAVLSLGAVGCETATKRQEDESVPAPGAAAQEARETPQKTGSGPAKANPEGARSPGDSPETTNAPIPPPPTAETVKLLNPGKAPRQVLRYRFEKGRTKTFFMQMSLEMKASADGVPSPAMPKTVFEFEGTTTTREVNADGSAVRDTVFSSFRPKMPNLPPQMAEEIKRQMKGFEGMRITETITSRGEVASVDVDEKSVTSAQAQMFLRNLMEGMSNAFLPLPEEAVGVGASWQGSTQIAASGVNVTQAGTFELKTFEKDQAKIDMVFKQSARPQVVAAPGVDAAFKTELLSMEGEGRGTTKVDLKQLTTAGQIQISTKTVTKVTSDDPAQPLPSPTAPADTARSVTSTLETTVGVIMAIK